ncbi:MAG: McrC family protein [Gammaproteobacteria bacterium]|nr:McrC family protein [Gammaproteobacteria bacterium]
MPIIKEYKSLTTLEPQLTDEEFNDLKQFALDNQRDKQDNHRPVLQLRNNNDLRAQNYVGIITTRKGTVLEILPKIDLGDDKNNKKTKEIFLKMLRTWRGLSEAQFSQSNINALQRFSMLEAFIRLFLDNLISLTQRGIAKQYQAVEDNLACLKGRLLFPQHLGNNLTNQARFYVGFDEFSADRPANRLINSAIHKLIPMVRQSQNQQLLYQLRLCFDEIPLSRQWQTDWDRHRVDRTMQHYNSVMQWVGLFLFGHGLTTFRGKHVNQSLLFPMEEVFEDFVTHHIRKHQDQFSVKAQRPQRPLAHLDGTTPAFQMKPDISLTPFDKPDDVRYILDTKWKHINENANDPKRDISQTDMYQLYSYGKKYGCEKVALIYPSTDKFKFENRLYYRFDDNLSLYCFPFDVEHPKKSVGEIISSLQNKSSFH